MIEGSITQHEKQNFIVFEFRDSNKKINYNICKSQNQHYQEPVINIRLIFSNLHFLYSDNDGKYAKLYILFLWFISRSIISLNFMSSSLIKKDMINEWSKNLCSLLYS